eukprot:scaffold603_cov404-Prasinococcus_capsulatus_cf.AAC.54
MRTSYRARASKYAGWPCSSFRSGQQRLPPARFSTHRTPGLAVGAPKCNADSCARETRARTWPAG